MNKGGKMSKIKRKLFSYKENLWKPIQLLDIEQTIKEMENLEPYVELSRTRKRCY